MFTDEGNQVVAKLVDKARHEGWDWSTTLNEIRESSHEGCEEICDTMVRELVYDAIGATGDFYL